jgi:hypothetical protein
MIRPTQNIGRKGIAQSLSFIQTLMPRSLIKAVWYRPTMHRSLRHTLLIATLTPWLVASSDGDSPEQQVRTAITQIELAAEARDTSDVAEWLDPAYRDAHGNDNQEVQRLLRGYFLTNQSIHLLTRIQELSFPHPDEARVVLQVAMVGQEADAANAWNLAGDLHRFELSMISQDGEWRVNWARWQRD